jgi:hypothetical protein
MTQAHKTPGAIVIIKDEWKDQLFVGCENDRFEVVSQIYPGHLHVRSIDHPLIEFKGLHDERFITYRGKDLKELKRRINIV